MALPGYLIQTLHIWLALSVNFTNEQHFEKIVHKYLRLTMGLNNCMYAMCDAGSAFTLACNYTLSIEGKLMI